MNRSFDGWFLTAQQEQFRNGDSKIENPLTCSVILVWARRNCFRNESISASRSLTCRLCCINSWLTRKQWSSLYWSLVSVGSINALKSDTSYSSSAQRRQKYTCDQSSYNSFESLRQSHIFVSIQPVLEAGPETTRLRARMPIDLGYLSYTISIFLSLSLRLSMRLSVMVC